MPLIPMSRPANGFGSNGKAINVHLNLFKIAMSPKNDFFHYNIEILSSKGTSPPIAMKKRIFKDIYALFARTLDGVGPVFDGDRTVYSHRQLTPLEGTVQAASFKLPPEKEEFKFILTEVEKPKWRTSDIFHALFGPHGPTMNNKSDADKTALINTSRRAMQAINVAIRYLLAADCPSTSRAFFPDQAPSLPIGGGVLLRRGYITHLRLGNTTNFTPPPDNLFLAMDMTCATFLEAPPQANPANTLADLCCKILNIGSTKMYNLGDDDYRKLHKVLRRFKINIKRGESDKGITKSIDHLTLTNSRNEIFETDEGKTSVEVSHNIMSSQFGYQLTRSSYLKAFFLKTWGKRLCFPDLPNVVTMGKGKKTVYPLELCSIRPVSFPKFLRKDVIQIFLTMTSSHNQGQRYILKLTGDQQSAALRFQTLRPSLRFDQIMLARRHVMKSEHEKLLSVYGIRIAQEFVGVQARVLPPPVVEYRGNLRIPVRDGQWNIAKPNLQFIQPKVLKSWAVVVCTNAPIPDQPIMNFLRALRDKLIQLGIQVADAPPPVIRLQPPGQMPQVKEALERAGKTAWQSFQKVPPQLFLCITDERSFLYNTIKVEGDVSFSFPAYNLEKKEKNVTLYISISLALCISWRYHPVHGPQAHVRVLFFYQNAQRSIPVQVSKVPETKELTAHNIEWGGRDRNLKIGGLNHRLTDLEPACGGIPTMIVGADLTHNNLSPKMKPSIAALVGSLDRTLLKYAPAVGVQPLLEPSDEDSRPRSQEPILLFRSLLTELLEKWGKNNPALKFPRKMVIFRDGVSDGEFTQVLESEFKAAKGKTFSFGGGSLFENKKLINQVLSLISVSSFSCDNLHCVCQKVNRSGNAPAGTVLDHQIGDPNLFDFFSQTQAGLQGTSRPTRYVVLKDESNASADQLQSIIQIISSGFQRATRSVGLATPAYVFAARAKMWLNADDDGASTVMSSSSGRDQTAEERTHDLEVYQQRIQSMMARLQSLDQQMWWI
ncbi:hypothetical protein VP01_453g12 [Puccinia sorghi]|uniref:Piwi domain-containing protein n=1 Tax=Puccinia sorghi TaxID=27349 RepID=A0A0L6UQV9_9BASI|nr:hypothetical protein VP01_453g12 [Puccinia sorghi]